MTRYTVKELSFHLKTKMYRVREYMIELNRYKKHNLENLKSDTQLYKQQKLLLENKQNELLDTYINLQKRWMVLNKTPYFK